METKNFQTQDSFEELLKEVNEYLFNAELADIIEVTYAYADLWDGRVINKTLFWTFLWKTYQWKDKNEEKMFWERVAQNIQECYNETRVKLVFKKQQLQRYKQKLLVLWEQDNPRLQILLGSLDYLDSILDLTITGLPFEAQKGGLNYRFQSKEVQNRVKHLEETEKKLFWWNVRKNKYEVQGSFEVLKNLFEKQKEKLTSEEQEGFSSYLQILKQSFSYITDSAQNDKDQSKNWETFDILSREISRENYVKVLKLAMEIYGIEKPVVVEERSSIYDGEDYLGIPESDAYKTLKIQRVLELIQHEIETHYIIERNNAQTLWKFRWGWNLPREEWLAMTVEWFLKWKNLDDIKVSWAIPDLLMGEILSWKEYKEFLELYAKLKGTKNASGMFLRRKRNYPLDSAWVQHKDTSYNRWQHKILDFMKSWDVKDLYLWKVSFEDIAKTKEIVAGENIKLMYPLLIWELLQYVILWNELKENDFWDYIERKYPFLNIRQEISTKSIERLTFSMKRKVAQILQLLK